MRFTQDFIEKIQEANNLVDIISQYTQLKPSGHNMMGRCPFPDHQEKTASFSVSESKQLYHCFGCKKSGNLFSFLRDYNGMSFPEAIEYLAGRASIALPPPENVSDKAQEQFEAQKAKKKSLAQVNVLSAFYFHENLKRQPTDGPVWDYVCRRNLSPATVEAFQIGYVADEWNSLSSYLASKKVPAHLMIEAGLAKARDGGSPSDVFDLFRSRLIFPIFNINGEPIAFGGRILGDGQPKYLNSPETPTFSKSRTLYGLNLTARHIRSEDCAIIVEGYMDLVGLYQAGIQNVAATLGTALTAEHGKILRRMTQNIVVLFDGDDAGQAAAEKSLPILLNAGLMPKALTLPDEMDPDEFVTEKGADTLRKMMDEAPDLFTVILKKWMATYRGEASQKVKLCDLLAPIFISIQDSRLLSLYLREAAEKMRVEPQWLKQALQQSGRQASGAAPVAPLATPVPQQKAQEIQAVKESEIELIDLKGLPRAELLLLGISLRSLSLWEEVKKENILDSVLHPGAKLVFQLIDSYAGQGPEKFDKLASLLVHRVTHPETIVSALEEISKVGSEGESKLLTDCTKRIRERYLDAQLSRLSAELKVDRSPEKLEQFVNIQKEKLMLAKSGRALKDLE